ncbi:S-adenosyl-L-methionine-dependent methyltransferase [Dimargaris cristalligena]|uniref:S-adenosyl-L-methionine-dependent methyltransferase n=1 Tax=Dimargaris cristalligena TaxID=215637 RepID=A0A4P9ZVN7_9FUNG|nr:S-adenosyl-L-methionine-dependent methyltransferase [Dimargaris cristalligena]|eukprot:RKP37674.1 S-adenosyl-L-methionine-dependent methyltransferase [Dimargaris cristalligena]
MDPESGLLRVWSVNRVEKAAHGLTLVAKNAETFTQLQALYKEGAVNETYIVICHGDVAALLANTKTVTEDPNLRDLGVVSTSRSNSSGYLTTLRIAPNSPLGGAYVRRIMIEHGYPVVGIGTRTRPLKASGKGLLLALTELEFTHPTTGERVAVCLPEPEKFGRLREREAQFYQRKAAKILNELASLEQAVVEGQSSDLMTLGQTFDHTRDMPLAYQVGEKTFCSLAFKVTPDTLIPRPASETLVEAALQLIRTEAITPQPSSVTNSSDPHPLLHVLDIGTGCGCLLIPLLLRAPQTRGVGLDISEGALNVARENGQRHGVESDRVTWLQDDMATLDQTQTYLTTHSPFDLIVCNPPYLSSVRGARKLDRMAQQHEPAQALFADQDGYEHYYALAEVLRTTHNRVLRSGGILVLEAGQGMTPRVKRIFEGTLSYLATVRDPHGMERCLIFQR